MKDLTFVTSNPNKAREAGLILGQKLRRAPLELDELQSMDLRAIIEHKTRQAYAKLKRPVLVEDVGLYLDAWNGFPGPFIKWLHHTMGYDTLPSLLPKRNRGATWIVMYGLYDGKTFHAFEGKLSCTIAKSPRGPDGWGFDVLLIPNGYTKTFAELGGAVKHKISARYKALMKVKTFLER